MARVSGASTQPSGVRFPLSVLNAVSTATKLVEQYRNRTRVHIIVPVVATKRIKRAVYVVDTVVLSLDGVAFFVLIFGHRCCPHYGRKPNLILRGARILSEPIQDLLPIRSLLFPYWVYWYLMGW